MSQTRLRLALSVLCAALVAPSAASQPTVQTWYPDWGYLSYGGYNRTGGLPDYANVYLDLYWSNPGGWASNLLTAVEIDFNIYGSPTPWQGCDSMTELPFGYDDCVTAGVDEDTGVGFGFGTFDGRLVVPGRWYLNSIDMAEVGRTYFPSAYPFDWNVTAQELQSTGCLSPWCLLYKYRSEVLLSQRLPNIYKYGEAFHSWDDRRAARVPS